MKKSAFLLGFLFITSSVLMGAGCMPDDPQDENLPPPLETSQARLDTPFTLSVSETMQIKIDDAYGLNLTFTTVENDSRCPIGAQCIWAGEATVQVKISSSTVSEQNLSLKTDNLPAEFDGYLISLVELSPVPTMDMETDPNDYQAIFSISEK